MRPTAIKAMTEEHYPGCEFVHGHHNCAVKRIQELEAENDRLMSLVLIDQNARNIERIDAYYRKWDALPEYIKAHAMRMRNLRAARRELRKMMKEPA